MYHLWRCGVELINMGNEKQSVRSIHYLGSKLRMLDTIKDAIDSVDDSEGTVCDLFSGSGTVSKYLLQYRDVVSVDIQTYSKVLCEASTQKIEFAQSSDYYVKEIQTSTLSKKIIEAFTPITKYEKTCTDRALNASIESLYEIVELGSIYVYLHESVSGISDELKKAIDNAINNLEQLNMADSPDTMITRYFGGLYYSYEQTVLLDCIAAFVFRQSGLLKTKMLAALLSTASDAVNTVGKQFAQPLKVKKADGTLKSSLKNKIISDRSLDIMAIFKKWLEYYLHIEEFGHSCSVLCEDYQVALKKLNRYDVKAVYADPPYTRYHYSRYYHVLETICLRDNPEVSTTFANGSGGISRAIYRTDRHQSPFCIKSQAELAFEQLFSGVKNLGVPLILSYSPFDASKAVTPRLRTIDQLVEMAREYYNHVNIVSPGSFTHSKLNSSELNFESNHEAELLIVCHN